MHIVSLHFLLLVGVGLILFHAVPSAAWRRVVLLGLNAALILSYVNSPTALVPLLAFLLLCFALIRAVQARPSKPLFIISVLIFIAAFVYLKQYPFARFAPSLGFSYVIIGLSYIFFRLLQVLVDAYQGAITERLSLWRVFNHSFFFLSFLSGPIQRFQDYRSQEDALDKISLSSEAVTEAFSRIVNGCIKIAFLSVILLGIFEEAQEWLKLNAEDRLLALVFTGACMSYLLHMYINFSGYMDIIIGVGALFGFKLPENFDWPLSSANLLDLWKRWHITLGEWFKTYLFNPLVKSLIYRSDNIGMTPAFGVIAYFLTFFVMGIWHNGTVELVLYGFLLGYGVSFNKLYEIEMAKYLGKKPFAKLRANFFYRTFANGLMLAYFALTLSCLWMGKHELFRLALTLGVPGVTLCFGVVIAAVMTIRLLLEGFSRAFHPLSGAFQYIGNAFFFRQLSLATRVFALTILFFASVSNIPEIVYMGF